MTGSDWTPRHTVLILSDKPTNPRPLRDSLEAASYRVVVAGNGNRALSRISSVHPDIILLDVTMPGSAGYEICRRVKTSRRWRDTPVLFLVRPGTADKVRAFEAGAVDCITKSSHPREVVARVQAHLKIRTLENEGKEKSAILDKAVALRIEAENRLQQSLVGAALVVFEHNQIRFCTRLARRVLDRYFPSQREKSLLPAPLLAWSLNGKQNPWQKDFGRTRLRVRMFAQGQPDGYSMIALEEHSVGDKSPASLLCLGITAREADVLFWIARGKTSPEIAIILNAAPNTVKKHVQNILVKLRVGSRLEAALRAMEVLATANA